LFFAPRVALEIQDARFAAERKIAEQALQEANLRLIQLDKHKNWFLAVLSHELRNPLMPIKNGLHILDSSDPGGERAARARAVIGRQVDQLTRLVDDLLDLTRVTQDKIQLARRQADLNDVAYRAAEDNRPLFEKGGQRLDVDVAATPVPVYADPARLAQIVGNLLVNAAKFTSRGGHTRLSVSIDETTRHAVLSVADTGIGLAPDTLPRLFHPFMQVEATLDRSRGGLGLGLVLVKRLVELHQGTIAVHSAGLGCGAEFVVRLPLQIGDTASTHPVKSDARQHRRRVLIVEDNVDAALSMSEALEMDHYEVAVAYDGPAGLAKAHEFHPEVMLCDIGLPGMNGYELAREVRRDASLKDVHLVALSGYALPDDLKRAEDAGFEQHLAKPPSIERVEALLATISA
jgi:CheY-like chemotaxis protein/nitrogen-specific signal transduction histidine kinase